MITVRGQVVNQFIGSRSLRSFPRQTWGLTKNILITRRLDANVSCDTLSKRTARLIVWRIPFDLPHAIVVRLHERKVNVVILTPETASTVGVCAAAYPCR